jgi:pilus assembly protein CpaC
LTALSGETASFLAGGEIPIPVASQLGQVSVQFKQYGVSLAFTPVVLTDGRISLKVRPEVSQLTTAGSVQVNGFTIPALSTRRVETTVELGSGQSFMIGGLLQNTQNNVVDKAPGLGSLPIIGALFRSTEFRKNETELVVVVTPYLVRPVSASDIILPTDGLALPSDEDRILRGASLSGRSGAKRPQPRMETPRTIAAPGLSPALPSPSASTAQPPATKQKKANSSALPLPGFTQ